MSCNTEPLLFLAGVAIWLLCQYMYYMSMLTDEPNVNFCICGNYCKISTNGFFLAKAIQKYAKQHNLVRYTTYPWIHSFWFVTDNSDDVEQVLESISQDILEIISNAISAIDTWRKRTVLLAVLVGSGSWYAWALYALLYTGDFELYAYRGAVGTLVALINLWSYFRIEE